VPRSFVSFVQGRIVIPVPTKYIPRLKSFSLNVSVFWKEVMAGKHDKISLVMEHQLLDVVEQLATSSDDSDSDLGNDGTLDAIGAPVKEFTKTSDMSGCFPAVSTGAYPIEVELATVNKRLSYLIIR
jgi:hypothetical protein